jgi:hypothetical protein
MKRFWNSRKGANSNSRNKSAPKTEISIGKSRKSGDKSYIKHAKTEIAEHQNPYSATFTVQATPGERKRQMVSDALKSSFCQAEVEV